MRAIRIGLLEFSIKMGFGGSDRPFGDRKAQAAKAESSDRYQERWNRLCPFLEILNSAFDQLGTRVCTRRHFLSISLRRCFIYPRTATSLLTPCSRTRVASQKLSRGKRREKGAKGSAWS